MERVYKPETKVLFVVRYTELNGMANYYKDYKNSFD